MVADSKNRDLLHVTLPVTPLQWTSYAAGTPVVAVCGVCLRRRHRAYGRSSQRRTAVGTRKGAHVRLAAEASELHLFAECRADSAGTFRSNTARGRGPD